MELEFAADGVDTADAYPLPVFTDRFPIPAGQEAAPGDAPAVHIVHRAIQRVDWGPLVEAVLADVRRGIAVGLISARFHNALAEAIVSVACATGIGRVVLSGGCFQNRRLLERAIRRLREEGFQAYWHQRVPPNDGGIALGQMAAFRWNLSSAPSGSFPDSACD
jgi:hydrogenase maturation protein HypF